MTTFSLRVRAYGHRYTVRLGTELDGWTEARADMELANVYAQISADLAQAKTLMPSSKFSDPAEHWRASKGAVLALQAKVALYNQKWTEVISTVTELEGLNFYSLNPNYFDSFAKAGANGMTIHTEVSPHLQRQLNRSLQR